ncbi:unnamed protein product [Musa hybrid cultivar]
MMMIAVVMVVMLCSQCLISVEARSIVEHRNLLANGLGMTPPMGYVFFSDHKIFKSNWNTWNHFYYNINETIIRESGTNILMSDALVSIGLAKLGYRYVNIDDCWAEHDRDSTIFGLQTWPKPVQIRAQLAPNQIIGLTLNPNSNYMFLTGNVEFPFGELSDELPTDFRYTLGFLPVDSQQAPGLVTSSASLWQRVSESVCECECQNLLANGLGMTLLMGYVFFFIYLIDSCKFFDHKMYFKSSWNTWNHFYYDINETIIRESGTNILMCFLQQKISRSAPLINVRSMTKETLANHGNKEVIDVNQDPLDVQAKKVRMDGDHEVWVGPLSGYRTVVVLLNRSPEFRTIATQWDDIGLPPNMVVEVRDLWKHVTLEKRFVNELRAPPCLQDVHVDASYTILRG